MFLTMSVRSGGSVEYKEYARSLKDVQDITPTLKNPDGNCFWDSARSAMKLIQELLGLFLEFLLYDHSRRSIRNFYRNSFL